MKNWNQWVKFVFASEFARSKPWREQGIHPMTWASQLYTKALIEKDGCFDASDYSDVDENDPESLLMAKEEMEQEISVVVSECASVVVAARAKPLPRFRASWHEMREEKKQEEYKTTNSLFDKMAAEQAAETGVDPEVLARVFKSQAYKAKCLARKVSF